MKRIGPRVGVHLRTIMGVEEGVLLSQELLVDRVIEDAGGVIVAECAKTYVVGVGCDNRLGCWSANSGGGPQRQCIEAPQSRLWTS